jgi:signal transduction histidine kinase
MLLLVGCMGVFILVYQKRILKEKQMQAKRELEYQNQMIQQQLESQESERKRISADLHDSLGSLLWGAKVNASYIQRSTKLSGEALNSHTELLRILDDSINTMRRISWELSPEAFQYSGLSESVKKLCQQLDGKGIDIQFSENESQAWNTLDALQVFRIIQELLSNAVKHSHATLVQVSLTWVPTLLEITVSDNGIGFTIEKNKRGVGLWNIEQRVKQLQAKLFIGVTPTGSGTTINIKIPLPN